MPCAVDRLYSVLRVCSDVVVVLYATCSELQRRADTGRNM